MTLNAPHREPTSDWLRVEDYPMPNETPMALMYNGRVCFGYLRWDAYRRYKKPLLVNGACAPMEYVTHWMPLPEPPVSQAAGIEG